MDESRYDIYSTRPGGLVLITIGEGGQMKRQYPDDYPPEAKVLDSLQDIAAALEKLVSAVEHLSSDFSDTISSLTQQVDELGVELYRYRDCVTHGGHK